MSKLLTPAPQSPRVSLGLLLLRIVAGVAMLMHGLGKLQSEKGPSGWMEGWNAPELLQTLSPAVPFTELLGGALLALGLVTPLAALLVAGTMAGAVWFHVSAGQPFVGQSGSYELAAMHLGAAVLVLLAGPGAFSLDKALFKARG